MATDARYPIGKFSPPANISPAERRSAVEALAELPQQMRSAVRGLSEAQIDTPYRENGWTLRQTVHHVADSHMHSSARMRLALTEEWPTVFAYKENLWAELTDARTLPVEVSLGILDGVHTRWIALFHSLAEEDWTKRGYTHPTNGRQALDRVALLYARHGRHHCVHITALRERMGW